MNKTNCEGDYEEGVLLGLETDEGYYEIKKKINEIKPEEILGSPITLAVVLRSVKVYAKKDLLKETYEIPQDVSRLIYDWDLLHDNYDLQSEETKKFIGEILGVKD